MALVKPLSDGSLAICFVNFGDKKSEMSLQFWDMGISYAENIGLSFYNCYTKQDEGKFAERYVAQVEPHDTMVFIAAEIMANYKTCRTCGAPLHDDDIAIYRKLVYRGAEDFLCIQCLADYFKCPKEEIEKRIRYYRESGVCTLFR